MTLPNHILLGCYYEKIADLILDRIHELDEYKTAGFDIDNINEVKMHDAILVYGSRGNGKSTIMINLQDFITGDYAKNKAEELKHKVRVFETIDPTIQEDDEDFLLVILSVILKAVENYHDNSYSNRDGFYDSLEKVLKIVEATRSQKKNDIDIFDKFYGLKSGVGLAEELHNLFKHTKNIFNVEILIMPIDDVDMNLKQGYQIADSIRKYMSSPYIIPIVAFNIRQMRVVTKYNKYKEFGLQIDNELELEELSFLRSLPNDYLSKVFPPNRRIYLKSVFDILKETLFDKYDKDKDKDIIVFKKNEKLALQAIDMVSLISELFYELYYKKENFYDIYKNTFLTNRSMRNFLNDCYCILASLEVKEKEENKYKINRQIIKDRLAPDDIPPFLTKEHALTWLWNEYILVAKKNLTNTNTLKNYNWAKMVTETLPEDNSAEIINKKTYARIWLQQYYRIDECIKKENINKQLNNQEYSLQRTCDISGALELAMRSYIPMYLFENIVRNHKLKYNNSDLTYLKSFDSMPLQNLAYELSMMEVTLLKTDDSAKPIGAIVITDEIDLISQKEFNIPFLFKVANQDKIVPNDKENSQIYILSIFKALALFIELSKVYEKENQQKRKNKSREDLAIQALIEKFRVNMPTDEKNEMLTMKESYFKNYINDKCNPVSNKKNRLEIDFYDSSFGVLEIASFSKRLVDFFMNVRDNIGNKHLISFDCNQTALLEDDYSPLITYFTSFGQSLFISLFHSIKQDDIISIKASKVNNKNTLKDEIIFRKNSLYGTKDNKLYCDHLYQENICNLHKIVKVNKKYSKNKNYEKFNQIQNDFDILFTYINQDIPFFNFLITKAAFLTNIQSSCTNIKCEPNATN